jgi:hypothetical protein
VNTVEYTRLQNDQVVVPDQEAMIEDVFNGHKDWLLSVQDKQLGKYHAMAHRIYKLCR